MHNLEHGWTIVWYDETIADDTEQMKLLKATADKFDAQGERPAVQHDHRAVDQRRPGPPRSPTASTSRSPTGRSTSRVDESSSSSEEPASWGESQYCDTFSGEALDDFMKKFPYDDAPEGYLWHQ